MYTQNKRVHIIDRRTKYDAIPRTCVTRDVFKSPSCRIDTNLLILLILFIILKLSFGFFYIQ